MPALDDRITERWDEHDPQCEFPEPLSPEEREAEGLRRENFGLSTQRMAAIRARCPHGRFTAIYEDGRVARLGWDWGGSNV